jgi:hypothetical protein
MVAPPSRPFHWPGGIPPEVKPDANGDITPEEADEDAKGWLLFVEVRYSPLSFDLSRKTRNRTSLCVVIIDSRKNGCPALSRMSPTKMETTKLVNDEHW